MFYSVLPKQRQNSAALLIETSVMLAIYLVSHLLLVVDGQLLVNLLAGLLTGYFVKRHIRDSIILVSVLLALMLLISQFTAHADMLLLPLVLAVLSAMVCGTSYQYWFGQFQPFDSIYAAFSLVVFSVVSAALSSLALFYISFAGWSLQVLAEPLNSLNFFEMFFSLATGNIVLAPFAMMLFGQQGPLLTKRVKFLVPTMTVCILLLIALVNVISVFHTSAQKDHLAADKTRITHELSTAFNSIHTFQNAVADYLKTNQLTDVKSFNTFIGSFDEMVPSVYFSGWLPKVMEYERQQYEDKFQADYGEGFQILSLGSQGEAKRSPVKEVYFPLTYAVPAATKAIQYGRDFLSLRSSQALIGQAISTGSVVSSEPFVMDFKDAEPHKVFALYQPVFRDKVLLGVVTVWVSMEQLIQQQTLQKLLSGMVVQVTDIASGKNYLNANISQNSVELTSNMNAFGRQLKIRLQHSDTGVSVSNGVYFAVGVTVLLSLLIMLLADLTASHKDTIKSRVDSETKELNIITKAAVDSERKIRELLFEKETVQQSLELSNIAFNHAAEAIVIIDDNGNVILTNQAFVDVTGQQSVLLIKLPVLHDFTVGEVDFNEGFWQKAREKGNWKGELQLRTADGTDLPILVSISYVKQRSDNKYVIVFSNISDMKTAHEEILSRANHDSLTNLPSRTLFHDRLAQSINLAKRINAKVCLMFIDLNKFKLINDTLGHDAGDELLTVVARRIQESVRETDTVARLGGDEFTVILNNISSTDDCTQIADKIIARIMTPFKYKDNVIHPECSIGMAFYPDSANSDSSLIKCADRAMYVAKQSNLLYYEIYNDEIESEWQSRELLSQELERGFENDEFLLFLQPIVALDDKAEQQTPVVYESLLRWMHPDRGVIPAKEFIPALTEMNMTVKLDLLVIDKIKTYLNHESSFDGAAVSLSFNINLQSLLNDEIRDVITRLPKLIPENHTIYVEISETELTSISTDISELLDQLRRSAIRICIDNFGTNYAPLFLLRKLAPEMIKLDKKLIDDLAFNHSNQAIIRAINSVASDLNIRVVAQGIEDIQQLNELRLFGFSAIQGFAVAPPMHLADVAAYDSIYKHVREQTFA